jgi:hypothetical protein
LRFQPNYRHPYTVPNLPKHISTQYSAHLTILHGLHMPHISYIPPHTSLSTSLQRHPVQSSPHQTTRTIFATSHRIHPPLDYAKRLKSMHTYNPKSKIHAGRYTPTQIPPCKSGRKSNKHFIPLQTITLAQVNPMQIFTNRIYPRVPLCCSH